MMRKFVENQFTLTSAFHFAIWYYMLSKCMRPHG